LLAGLEWQKMRSWRELNYDEHSALRADLSYTPLN
jgi:hypothetical protein